jgi:hypothetical protein
MTNDSTRPMGIEGTDGPFVPPWQPHQISWSFGATEQRVVGWPRSSPPLSRLPNSENRDGPSTLGPQKITPPKPSSAVIRPRDFGKRSLQPLSHWEGVVEQVWHDRFRGRLVPLTTGHRDRGRVEFTEFSLDDLANESDRDLVQPGAIFYWTIAKGKNVAGTLTNISLVRFRRVPPLSRQKQERARIEAEELLLSLGDSDRSDSPLT